MKALSDAAWLNLIHDGIPEEGMPGFPGLGGEDAHAVVAYLRSLQGRSAGNSVAGNPAQGQDLFFGKAGCTACHQIGGRGQFVTGDLAGFARDHPGDEIRDAILRPTGEPQEVATVVARDGRTFSGMLRNEDNASLQLQDGDGRFYLLMKSSVVSVQRKIGIPCLPITGSDSAAPSLTIWSLTFCERRALWPLPHRHPQGIMPSIEGQLRGVKTEQQPRQKRIRIAESGAPKLRKLLCSGCCWHQVFAPKTGLWIPHGCIATLPT